MSEKEASFGKVFWCRSVEDSVFLLRSLRQLRNATHSIFPVVYMTIINGAPPGSLTWH